MGEGGGREGGRLSTKQFFNDEGCHGSLKLFWVM